ncbi:MAG: hypothetical protein ACXWWD_11225 [Chitinophagaceae bacterium]
MSFLPPLYVYFIVISFMVSLSVYFFPKNVPSYLKLFPPFLLATALVEILATYMASIGKSNLWLYNFFTVIEFCFYLWIVSLIISNIRMKKIIRITLVLYALASTVNIIFIQEMKAFHTGSYAIGCLLIVAVCAYYFFELFKLPKSVKLKNNPAFWICSGLLFFYCCGFPLYGLTNFISGISKLIISNFFAIIIILNIFLYSLFTIAFLCRLKTRKYTSSPS